ncbi:MAG: hypothetical protein JNJ44_09285 [Zoogloeaceae bacterium]|nr:hypothetical protein [Zoogloeaceae bacterium]
MVPEPPPPESLAPPSRDDADDRQRLDYIERNLSLALVGMILFALALLGA